MSNTLSAVFLCAVVAGAPPPPATQPRGTLVARWEGKVYKDAIIWLWHGQGYTLAAEGTEDVLLDRLAPLPSGPALLSVRVLRGRGVVRVVQHPAEAGHHVGLVWIHDYPQGPDVYRVEIYAAPGPVPGPAAVEQADAPPADGVGVVFYNQKRRSEGWVNAVYEQWRHDVCLLDGKYYVLPRARASWTDSIEVGKTGLVIGRVTRVIGPHDMLLEMYTYSDGPRHTDKKGRFARAPSAIQTAQRWGIELKSRRVRVPPQAPGGQLIRIRLPADEHPFDGQEWQGPVAGLTTYKEVWYTTRWVDGKSFRHRHERTVVHCVPGYGLKQPITKSEFLAALRQGLDLPGVK